VATAVDPPSIQPQLDASAERIRQRIERAVEAATIRLADNVLEAGRADIASAGKFGTRWTAGFTYEITGTGAEREIVFNEAVPYWRIHETGGIIRGKPLLWIPLSPEYGGDPVAQGVRARDFPGRLFRVNRKSGGAPLLLSADDKRVKYTGHTQVRLPKRFHLIEIIHAEAETFGALYRAELAFVTS
jgi:uncharacterized protein DUF6441